MVVSKYWPRDLTYAILHYYCIYIPRSIIIVNNNNNNNNILLLQMLNPITDEVAGEIKAICDVLGYIAFLYLY